MSRQPHHVFGPCDRHAVATCRHCKVKRRVLAAPMGASVCLYQHPADSLWSTFNPGCVGSYKHPLRACVVDPAEAEP